MSQLRRSIIAILLEDHRSPTNAATGALRYPITGIAGCCARAAIDHAAALPSSVMTSRRFHSEMHPIPQGQGNAGQDIVVYRYPTTSKSPRRLAPGALLIARGVGEVRGSRAIYFLSSASIAWVITQSTKIGSAIATANKEKTSRFNMSSSPLVVPGFSGVVLPVGSCGYWRKHLTPWRIVLMSLSI
jgi:hypothetical protein